MMRRAAVALCLAALTLFGARAEDVSSSSSSGGGVSSSGTFTAGDLVCGAGATSIQDCANYSGPAVAPKGLSITNNPVASASSNAAGTSALFWSGSFSGNCPLAVTDGCYTNNLITTGVTQTSSAPNGSGNLQIKSTINSASFTGSYGALLSQLHIAQTGNGTTNQFYGTGSFWTFVEGNLGGTGGTHSGSAVSMNPQILCETNATFLKECSAGEVNAGLQTGASSDLFYGWKVIIAASHATAASLDSGGFVLGIQGGGTNNLACGYCFGQNGGGHGVASTGMLLGASKSISGAVAYGVNLLNFPNFTTAAYTSNGFQVDGNGAINAASINVTSATAPVNGLYLPTINTVSMSLGSAQQFTWTTTANGWFGINATSGINATDQLSAAGGNNGVRSATFRNVSAGTGAQETIYIANNSSVTQASITLNGGGFSGGQGANALQISNTSTAPIVVGTGTEVIKFGSSGAFSANGAVVTALTGVGPTGSHTSVQKWFTITDNGGTVGYIPVFHNDNRIEDENRLAIGF